MSKKNLCPICRVEEKWESSKRCRKCQGKNKGSKLSKLRKDKINSTHNISYVQETKHLKG